MQCFLPVPGLEGIAGPLEQVALHHHAVRSVHVELHLGLVIGKVLGGRQEDTGWTQAAVQTGHPSNGMLF